MLATEQLATYGLYAFATIGGVGLVAFIVGALKMAVNPRWNHGRDPTKGHPNSKIVFDPKFTTLLYLDFRSSASAQSNVTHLRAVRIQFRSIGWKKGKNDWETNQEEISKWIKYLNDDTSSPLCTIKPDFWVYDHPTELFFNQPNHLAIYIRDKNINFDSRPVWFSDVLIKADSSGKPLPARENWSFFDASVVTPIDCTGKPSIQEGCSQEVLYMKNYFRHKCGFFPFIHYYKIKAGNEHLYSLNINALLEVAGQAAQAVTLPIVLDPDTGNNGGGEPTAD
ncbi:MAG TPA: hypothetical protein VE053_05330 [Allosphingosinicella sp.]|nr:hypothetical protein [Allosphingosinicella sp.]